MTSTYVSNLASMVRNLISPNRRTYPSSAPDVTIYAGLVGTINITTRDTRDERQHRQERGLFERSSVRTDFDRPDEPVFHHNSMPAFGREDGQYDEKSSFACPGSESWPVQDKARKDTQDIASLAEKAERLMNVRKKRSARIAKQRATGGRRWNRVLRNRLAAGL